jgi:hypothetical protein
VIASERRVDRRTASQPPNPTRLHTFCCSRLAFSNRTATLLLMDDTEKWLPSEVSSAWCTSLPAKQCVCVCVCVRARAEGPIKNCPLPRLPQSEGVAQNDHLHHLLTSDRHQHCTFKNVGNQRMESPGALEHLRIYCASHRRWHRTAYTIPIAIDDLFKHFFFLKNVLVISTTAIFISSPWAHIGF